jgi:hypothetical protein
LAQQQATGSFYDHMMFEALDRSADRNTRGQSGRVGTALAQSRGARHYEETAERERLDERCDQIIAAYRGVEREEFIDLVEEGTLLITEGRTRRGLRLLEQALAIDERNAELSFTVGEYYFPFGEINSMRRFNLRRALMIQAKAFRRAIVAGIAQRR